MAQDPNDCTITKQDHICCWPLLAACEFMCATIGSLSFSSPYFICESIFNRACRLNEVANVIIYSTLLDPLRSMLLRDAVGLAVYKTANP